MRMTKCRKYSSSPLLPPSASWARLLLTNHRFKIGDSFFSLPLPEAQSMLSASTETLTEEVSTLEESLNKLREEMHDLKVALYARFGKSINLET